ncbi:MAG: methyl-accepting chemotaxis protein [Lachnospiraceae bacterium]
MKRFKDFSISKKLSTGFLALVAVMLIVGAVGVFGMIKINNADTYLYEVQTAPIKQIYEANRNLLLIRSDIRAAIIYAGDEQMVEQYYQSYQSEYETYETNIQEYAKTISNPDTLQLYEEATALIKDTYVPALEESFASAKAGNADEALDTLINVTDDISIIYDNLNKIVDNRMVSAKSTSDENETTSLTLTVVLIVVIALGAGTAALLGRTISNSISNPIRQVVDAAEEIALGRININLSELDSKDETGILAAAFTKMLEGIRKQVMVAELISNGDFTQSVPLRSGEDALGLALQKIEADLSTTLKTINTAADQVNSGATQVSDGAQALSSGATEQAATIEQLNASITSVAEQAEQNADSVRSASGHVNQVGTSVAESNEYMLRLTTAMGEISTASEKIASVTKAIEDIAFQTNILALNAAIEAARAGNAGKGFAVVADEVRTLAARSAEAAKETAVLIGQSSEKVSDGEKLVTETARLLSDVAQKAQLVEQAIQEVESASSEQAAAIEQINQGLSQVSAVVQTNAATAEESSASSEELAAQAQILQQSVSKFKLSQGIGEETHFYNMPELQPDSETMIDRKNSGRSLTAPGSLGKY